MADEKKKVKKAQKELGSNVLSIVADVTKDSDREKIIDSITTWK